MHISSSVFSSVANKPFVRTSSLITEVEFPYRGRVDVIVVMPTMQPGWCLVPNSQGIIAVLIGLFMPAVQKAQAGDRSMIPAGLLEAGGKFGVHQAIVSFSTTSPGTIRGQFFPLIGSALKNVAADDALRSTMPIPFPVFNSVVNKRFTPSSSRLLELLRTYPQGTDVIVAVPTTQQG